MPKAKKIAKTDKGLAVSDSVADFYRENAKLGADNLGSALPLLKVTEDRSKNYDTEGNRVKVGTLYYAPERKGYEQLEVLILTISRGFYAMTNDPDPEKRKPKFNQMVGGVIKDSMKPFVMFFGGVRLQNMWNFGKEIGKHTRNPQNPVPMFTIPVVISTAEEDTKYGTTNVVTFEVVRDSEGNIMPIADLKTLSFLKENVKSLHDSFENFIEQREVDPKTGESIARNINSNIPAAASEEEDSAVMSKDEAGISDGPPPPTDEDNAQSADPEDMPEDLPF